MIFVLGDVGVIRVILGERLPNMGETVSGSFTRYDLGGAGAKQALIASALGAKVGLFSLVGGDADGQAATDLLELAGVNLSGVLKSEERTSLDVILMNTYGENSVFLTPLKDISLSVYRISSVKPSSSDYLFTSSEFLNRLPEEAIRTVLDFKRRGGKLVILDNCEREISERFLWASDILIFRSTHESHDVHFPSSQSAALQSRVFKVDIFTFLKNQSSFFRKGKLISEAPITWRHDDEFMGFLAADLHKGFDCVNTIKDFSEYKNNKINNMQSILNISPNSIIEECMFSLDIDYAEVYNRQMDKNITKSEFILRLSELREIAIRAFGKDTAARLAIDVFDSGSAAQTLISDFDKNMRDVVTVSDVLPAQAMRLEQLAESDLKDFQTFSAKPENTWQARKGQTASQFIEEKFAPWLGKGLRRADITTVQPKLVTAYAVEIHRYPERRITSLVDGTYMLPPNAERPPSLRRVSELTEEQKIERRRKEREKKARWLRRRSEPK